MIYFDNAATTWPKPPEVITAMQEAMTKYGANPGRAGHRLGLEAGRMIYATREKVARLFKIQDPLRVVFTSNATEALNLAILGLLKSGDHVITTSIEHNSVTRPLHLLAQEGVEVQKVRCDKFGKLDLAEVESLFRPNTRALIVTHASNVFGTIMPIEELGKIAQKHGVLFVVDGAQTAGVLEIDVQKQYIDLLAFPGHKSLLGPQGTGGLFIREGIELKPLKVGGTGSASENPAQPQVVPDRYESGTLNTVGLIGLGAGIDFINKVGIDNIRQHENRLAEHFMAGVKHLNGYIVYGPETSELRAPVVSINRLKQDSNELGYMLDKVYDIACRSGLHCAPDAHRAMGTFEQGTVRFSFGYYNTIKEVDMALEALEHIQAEL